MSQATPPDLRTVLAAYRQIMQSGNCNVEQACELGRALRHYDRSSETKRCFQAAVELLHRAAGARDLDEAIYVEGMIYDAFVKTEESEDHYRRCFAAWTDELAALGRSYRVPAAPAPADLSRVGFILPSGVVLGHTEVMFKVLEHHRPRAGEESPKIYVLYQYASRFVERAARLNIPVAIAEQEVPDGPEASALQRIEWLRRRMREDGCSVGVWVSVPPLAIITLSMRVAPVQIFWALRFHPISGPYIDGYISYGARHESQRSYGKQVWRVCPPPLTIDEAPPDPSAVAAARARFPEPFLFGTIAREDKINSRPYLESVARVLKANRHAGYVWTGRTEHSGISAFFRDAGVSERCHFVGWVDVKVYASVLDALLETFPLGGGISGYYALAAGVPLISFLGPYTIFGNHLWHLRTATDPSRAALDPDSPLGSQHILCARDVNEYVANANRVAADAAFRDAVGRAGRAFFAAESASADSDTQRFFDTIDEIARETLQRSSREEA